MKHLFFAVGMLAAFPSIQAAPCMPYEPKVVFLRGDLVQKTFPGPPNFESVADGDRADKGFYLRLLEPACTLDGGKDTPWEALADIRLVQLVLDQAGYDRLRCKMGTTVTLKGTLFAPHSAFHHGDALMTVMDPLAPNPPEKPRTR
jgi:hypothetical protein